MIPLTVVLVPGMLCDADLWADVRFPSGVEVVHAPIDAPSIDAMAEQVMAAVDGRFAVVGLSLGAIVSFQVALRATPRLAGLFVLSTNASAPTREQLTGWRRWAESAGRGGFASLVDDEILPTMFADRAPPPALRRRFSEMARRVGSDVFLRQLQAQATRTDSHHALSTVDIPVTVVGADRDALCPPAFHRGIAAALRDASHHQLADVGHLSPMEAPSAVGELISQFLRPLTAVPTRPSA